MAAKGSWEQGCGCVDRTSASTFPRQIFPRTAVLCHQRRLFWAAASPRCDRCKLCRSAMQLTGNLCRHRHRPRPSHSTTSVLPCASMRLHVPPCASLNLPQKPPKPPPKAARRIAMGESGCRAFVPQIIRTAVALLFAPFACFLTP